MGFEIVGALPPPPGVEPNFEGLTEKQRAGIAVNTVFLTLVTLAVILRVYTRTVIMKIKLSSDDCKSTLYSYQVYYAEVTNLLLLSDFCLISYVGNAPSIIMLD